MPIPRKPYPSDVSDDEWSLVAPHLALLPEGSGQRSYALRQVFNGSLYREDGRALALDVERFAAVGDRLSDAQRWLRAGCFETLAEDLRIVLRLAAGRRAAQGGDHRQPHPALHARERRARRLRRGQAQERLETTGRFY